MPTANELFDRYVSKGPVEPEVFGGLELYVAEGDLLLDKVQLDALCQQLAKRMAGVLPGDMKEGLVAMTDDGDHILRWRPGKLLSYAVVKNSFGNNAWYETAVDAMHQATASWESICGVEFEHLAALDTGITAGAESPAFLVGRVNAGGDFIAAAFFPDDPPVRRRVVIDPSFFAANLNYDRVGVLRHELGHVLGFRHEHILSGAPAICPNEDVEHILPLGVYDPKSVMHYFCGGSGTRELEFSLRDREDAPKVYGPPHTTFRYYD